MTAYKREKFNKLLARLEEKRRFIQVLAGPRQIGKTTLAQQVAEVIKFPYHFATADSPTPHTPVWIEQQ